MSSTVQKLTPEGVAASAEAILRNAVDELRQLRKSAEVCTTEGTSAEMIKWDPVLQIITAIEQCLGSDVASLKGEESDFTLEGFRGSLIALQNDCLQNTMRMHRSIGACEGKIPARDLQLLLGMAQIAIDGCRNIPDTIYKIQSMPLARVV